MVTYLGYKVIINDHIAQPKLKLSLSIDLPEDFRRKTDAWLLETFGRDEDKIIKACIQGEKFIIMTSSLYRKLSYEASKWSQHIESSTYQLATITVHPEKLFCKVPPIT